MKIYRVNTKMGNPIREHSDLYGCYDDAISFFNGIKNNPDCASIEVEKLEIEKDSSLFKVTEIVASYS